MKYETKMFKKICDNILKGIRVKSFYCELII